jgi:hypothetical protein
MAPITIAVPSPPHEKYDVFVAVTPSPMDDFHGVMTSVPKDGQGIAQIVWVHSHRLSWGL